MTQIFWIKIHLSLYYNRKMTLLQKMKDGGSLCYLWIQLLLLAGESNADGALMMTPNIPYTSDIIAGRLNWSPKLVKRALEEYIFFEMIYIFNETIFIRNWEKYQNTQAMAQAREKNAVSQRKSRAKKSVGNTKLQLGENMTDQEEIIDENEK